MLATQIQVGILVLVTAYLSYTRMGLVHRNGRSWADLAARLQPATMVVTPGARFRHAGVLLEMADYAERNTFATAILTQLRSDAIALRMRAARDMMRLDRSRGAH